MNKTYLLAALALSSSAALAQDTAFDSSEQQIVSEMNQVAVFLQTLGSSATAEQLQQGLLALTENVDRKAAMDSEQATRPAGQVIVPNGSLAFEGDRTVTAVEGASCSAYQTLVARIDGLYLQISGDTVKMATALTAGDLAQFRMLLDSTKKRLTEVGTLNAKVQLDSLQKIQVQWPLFKIRLNDLTQFRDSAVFAQPGVVGDGKREVLPRRVLEKQGRGFWWTEDQYIRAKPMSVYVDLWGDSWIGAQILQSPQGETLELAFEAPSSKACFVPESVVRTTTVGYTFSTDMYDCDHRTCRENYNEMIALDAPAFFYSN